MFGGQREEGISLDAVVAQYIKNTDLNQYNTEEPVRIINGLPESNEQPDTSKEDNDNIIIIQLMDMMVNNKHQIQTMMTKTILVILMIMKR